MNKTWNNEFLDEMRMKGDDEADEVAAILWKNKHKEILNTLKFISQRHHGRIEETLNASGLIGLMAPGDIEKVSNFYNATDDFHKTCTTEDIAHFQRNAEIFNKYGYLITTLLFFKSLPTGYMCPKPGTVLHTTKLLENFAARRVMETAQFIFAVNTDDWYKPGSRGLRAIEKVRLMHAGMRTAILNNPEKKWDMSLGVPINQEDVTLTNHLFSLAIIEGLDYMGIHLYQIERESIFHTWQKIGQALGIEEGMLNTSYEDAWKQYRTILKRQVSTENDAGPHLTKALLKAMNQLTEFNIPLEDLEDVTRYLVNDDRSTKSLGIHKPTVFDRIIDGVLHTILRSKIWQLLFHRSKGGWVQRMINKVGNKILIKRFNLGPYLKEHPNVNPLQSFTKVLLASLSKRDLTDFKNMNPDTIKKKFFIDDKLYLEWGLGGFNTKVDLSNGIDEKDMA